MSKRTKTETVAKQYRVHTTRGIKKKFTKQFGTVLREELKTKTHTKRNETSEKQTRKVNNCSWIHTPYVCAFFRLKTIVRCFGSFFTFAYNLSHPEKKERKKQREKKTFARTDLKESNLYNNQNQFTGTTQVDTNQSTVVVVVVVLLVISFRLIFAVFFSCFYTIEGWTIVIV